MSDAPGRASYLASRAGAAVARAIPSALGLPLVRAVSRTWVLASGTRRRQVERNVRRVTGGSLGPLALARATARVFDYYGRYWHELFRLRDETPETLDARFSIVGYEHLVEATTGGKGAIVALPHLGNWDLAGAWLASRGHRLTVVAEPVEPPELFEWFVAERAALGMEVVGLGPAAAAETLRALRDGRVLCLVCDRDLTGDGVPVDFFGAPTTMPGGPATLALRTGAALLPAGVYFRPRGRHEARIGEPLRVERRGRLRDDVVRVTQELAWRFEELIRAAPDQWLVMQPVWPDDGNGR